MKKRKILAITISMVLVAASLLGCGGNKTTKDSSKEAVKTTTDTKDTEDSKDTVKAVDKEEFLEQGKQVKLKLVAIADKYGLEYKLDDHVIGVTINGECEWNKFSIYNQTTDEGKFHHLYYACVYGETNNEVCINTDLELDIPKYKEDFDINSTPILKEFIEAIEGSENFDADEFNKKTNEVLHKYQEDPYGLYNTYTQMGICKEQIDFAIDEFQDEKCLLYDFDSENIPVK
ncbi:MAG: hypothetical protein ACERKV_11780 [Clostridiaceae bacterium]